MRCARTGDDATQRLSNLKPLWVERVPEARVGSWLWNLVATLTVWSGHSVMFALMAWTTTLLYFRFLASQRSFRTIRSCNSLWEMPHLSIRPGPRHTSPTTGTDTGRLCSCPAGPWCPILDSTPPVEFWGAAKRLPGVCSSTLFAMPTQVTHQSF